MADENIYTAPKATLTESQSSDSAVEFFPTSQTKLVALYLTTLGIYSIYWFYKHWKLQQEKHGENINPALRAIFYIFFTHSLFKRIEGVSVDKGVSDSWGASALATVFVLLSIVSNVLDRFSSNTESYGIVDYAGIVIIIVLVWPLYMVQGMANKVNDDPKGKLNSTYSIYNYIFITIGSLVWLLILIGLSL